MWFTFANEALLDEAPKHVAAMVTVRRLVERLLAEAVAVYDGPRLGRSCSARRHDRRARTAEPNARFSPDHGAQHVHFTHLCDVGAVAEHFVGRTFVCTPQLHV